MTLSLGGLRTRRRRNSATELAEATTWRSARATACPPNSRTSRGSSVSNQSSMSRPPRVVRDFNYRTQNSTISRSNPSLVSKTMEAPAFMARTVVFTLSNSMKDE